MGAHIVTRSGAEFAAAYPAPRLADFLKDAAGARREAS